MSVVLPFLLRLVRVICLVIFEAKIVPPLLISCFMTCADDKNKSDP